VDQFALRSHRLAKEAQLAGRIQPRIVPLTGPQGYRVEHDEGIRPTTDLAALAARPRLRGRGDAPPLSRDRVDSHGPQLLAIADGTAAMLIMCEQLASSLGLTPLAAVVASQSARSEVESSSTDVPATRRPVLLGEDGQDGVDVGALLLGVPGQHRVELRAVPGGPVLAQFACQCCVLATGGEAAAQGRAHGGPGVR
jgi:hypothetical protein